MADVAITTGAAGSQDGLESPARRALRRLLERKGAIVGLITITLLSCLRCLPR